MFDVGKAWGTFPLPPYHPVQAGTLFPVGGPPGCVFVFDFVVVFQFFLLKNFNMAALCGQHTTRASGGGMEDGAGKGAPRATVTSAALNGDIDFEAEAQSRGMELVSSTQVGGEMSWHMCPSAAIYDDRCRTHSSR